MAKNNRLSASYDNQVAAFLVKYCEEGDGYESALNGLFTAFKQVRGRLTREDDPLRHRVMSSTAFLRRMYACGFSWTAGSRMHEVVIKGVQLNRIEVKPGCDASQAIEAVKAISDETVEFYNRYQYPEYFDGDTEALKRWDEGVPSSPVDCVVKSAPIQQLTHIEVEGKMYDRDLIATVGPIRGFIDRNTGIEKKGIVTFNNAEMKHKFVTQADFVRIRAQLGL